MSTLRPSDPQLLAIMAAILYAGTPKYRGKERPGLDAAPEFYCATDAVEDARLLLMAAYDLHDRDTTAPQETP